MTFVGQQDEKKIVRSRLLNDLKEQSQLGALAHLHGEISNRLKLILPTGTFIGAYRNLSTEPDLNGLFEDARYQFCYPRVSGLEMQFYHVENRASFEQSSMGVLEPTLAEATLVQLKDISVLLVPGLGFDRQGCRLGRGKGYYDRTLQSYTGLKVGVCFSRQIVNEGLPREGHDVFMDYIVTEKFILKRYDS